MAPNETTPLLNTSEQCTPVSIVEDDTYTAALLRRSSIVLSELGEDFPPEGHIFIEVVQSPFEQFSYRAVFTTRLVLAMLMTVALGAYWVLEYSRGDGMIFWFRFGNLVWLGQTFYMWVVAVSFLSTFTIAVLYYGTKYQNPTSLPSNTPQDLVCNLRLFRSITSIYHPDPSFAAPRASPLYPRSQPYPHLPLHRAVHACHHFTIPQHAVLPACSAPEPGVAIISGHAT